MIWKKVNRRPRILLHEISVIYDGAPIVKDPIAIPSRKRPHSNIFTSLAKQINAHPRLAGITITSRLNCFPNSCTIKGNGKEAAAQPNCIIGAIHDISSSVTLNFISTPSTIIGALGEDHPPAEPLLKAHIDAANVVRYCTIFCPSSTSSIPDWFFFKLLSKYVCSGIRWFSLTGKII